MTPILSIDSPAIENILTNTTTMATLSRAHDAYTVGWVCALPKEQTAAIAMLDVRHPNLSKPPNDPNSYTLGSICGHNIVIACLPKGKIGINSAATVATHMVGAFPAVRFGLMVGIGGGVPPTVRLGDIVVSVPIDQYPGVVQWDMGKAEQNGTFRRTGALNNPPNLLLSALATLESDHELEGSKVSQYLEELQIRYPRLAEKYLRSDSLQDVLFKTSYSHVDKQHSDALEVEKDASEIDAEEDCRDCDKTQIIKRKPRDMRVHYGLIASGNQVVKDATVRDRLSKDMDKKVLCIEMEAAGLMDNFSCIVIRGICDYADSHKNKAWQEHAAAVAAAFAKELLGYVQPQDIDQEATVKDVLAQVSSELSETKSQVAQTRLILERDEDLKVLNWLTPIDFGPQHSDYLRRRQPGTGQWLLDHEIYQRWVEEPKQSLFCPGIPGAGKTILSAIVIDNLESRSATDSATVVVYIFCNFNRQAEQKLETLMSSLLKQLASKSSSLPSIVLQVYKKHAITRTRPSLEEISTALRTVATTFARIFVVVDALDECQVADNCRIRLLHQLFDLQARRDVNVFATSRHMPDIEKEFLEGLTIEIRATKEDIGRYVDSAVSRLPRFIAERSDLKEEITQTISQIVDGMFLLAQLYCDTLTDRYNPTAVRKALKNLKSGSKSYEAAYDDAMSRIEAQLKGQAELAKQVLAWIICAQRPLTKTELQHALAVEIGETKLDRDNITQVHDMVAVCAGLVTVDEASSVVRLVHYTTQKYFESTQDRWFPAAHSVLAEICTTYLSFDTFAGGRCQSDQEFEDRLKQYRFFEYAASYWGYHARAGPGREAVLKFLRKPAQIDASVQACFTDTGTRWRYSGYSQRAPSGMVATHLAAIFGLGNILPAVWNKRNQDAKDSTGRTPLSRAAEKGHTEVVKLLLGTKEVDVNARDIEGRTPLLRAAKNGHTDVLNMLLETKEVDVDARDEYDRTPLLRAAENGHTEVVKLLLETKEVDVNARDIEGRTPLLRAAKNGYTDVLNMLLETKEVDVNARDNGGRTPLWWAAEHGYIEMVKLLLETKELDVNAKDTRYGLMPLWLAAEHGHTEVVQLLLETKEVDVNAKDKDGRTPLWWAAEHGYIEMVKLLLETKEVDVNAKDKESGWTPLWWAAERGYTEMVKLLLETREVDVNAKDTEYGRTPLWCAAENGYTEVVKLLLQAKEVDVNAKDEICGQIPLWCAAENGYTEVVKLLLKAKEVDVNARDTEYGQTPLCCAAGYGHTEVVKMLLKTKKVDVNIKENTGQTPLWWAARYGHIEVVKLLLTLKEVDVNAKHTKYDWTPLWCAVSYRQKEVVELLLDRGADVNAQVGSYGTALQAASDRGHWEIVQLLLDKGADVNAQGGSYGTALQAASLGGHQEIVQLLVDKAADVNAQDGRYGDALQAASSRGHRELVQLLLDRGVDVNAHGGSYGTALQAASFGGHWELVQLLLDRGADVHTQRGPYGNALQAASRGGYRKITQLLLDRGADVNTQRGHFGTALQAASYEGHREIVQLLLDKGADVNAQGGHFGNALQAASRGGYREITQLLLDRGADVNAQDGRYGNALQAASSGGYQEIVQLLNDVKKAHDDTNLKRSKPPLFAVDGDQKKSSVGIERQSNKRKDTESGQESITKKPCI